MTPEQAKALRLKSIMEDPVIWAKAFDKTVDNETKQVGPWTARWYQAEILQSKEPRRVCRMGRRTGKCLPGWVEVYDPIQEKYIKIEDLYKHYSGGGKNAALRGFQNLCTIYMQLDVHHGSFLVAPICQQIRLLLSVHVLCKLKDLLTRTGWPMIFYMSHYTGHGEMSENVKESSLVGFRSGYRDNTGSNDSGMQCAAEVLIRRR